jgi:hypothetical protein
MARFSFSLGPNQFIDKLLTGLIPPKILIGPFFFISLGDNRRNVAAGLRMAVLRWHGRHLG